MVVNGPARLTANIEVPKPNQALPVAGLGSADPRRSTDSRMLYSRLIGALFLAGFLTYGGGFGLVTSVVGGTDFLDTVPAQQNTLVLGAFLMLLNTAVDVAKGVLFYPILAQHSPRSARLPVHAVAAQHKGQATGSPPTPITSNDAYRSHVLTPNVVQHTNGETNIARATRCANRRPHDLITAVTSSYPRMQ
jgi:hypothetical protein